MTGKPSPAQENAAIAWIQSELMTLPAASDVASVSTTSLCEFLRDGRALCLLAHALATDQQLGDEHSLPKKLEKSMHQLSTFHALERIHFFIKWCRRSVNLEEHLVFTSVQLLDEQNTDAVLACVDALRQRFRPSFKLDVAPAEEEPTEETADDTEDQEEELSASSSSPAPPASASKLLSFLSQVPPTVATAAPSTSPSPSPSPPPAAERPPSFTKRLSSASSASATSERFSSTSSRVSGSFASDLPDDADAEEEEIARRSTLSASPRATVSKLKLPPAFARSQTAGASTVKDEPKASGGVAKLEIPSVFGRQRSLSNTEDSTAGSAAANEEPPKPVSRSVSKLTIPAAFSAGAPAVATPPPTEEESTATTSSPPQPPSLASFLTSLEPEKPATPSPEVAEKKKARKLVIPALFGKAVGAAAPPKVEKPVSKLAAFLSTVETEPMATAPPAPMPAWKRKQQKALEKALEKAVLVDKPVVVAESVKEKAAEVAFEAEVKQVLATEPEVAKEETETKSSVVEEPVAAEPTPTPAPVEVAAPAAPVSTQRSNKLLAFLAAVESTPTAAPSLSESLGTATEEVKRVVEEISSAPAPVEEVEEVETAVATDAEIEVEVEGETVAVVKTEVETELETDADFTVTSDANDLQTEEDLEEYEVVDAEETVEAVEATKASEVTVTAVEPEVVVEATVSFATEAEDDETSRVAEHFEEEVSFDEEIPDHPPQHDRISEDEFANHTVDSFPDRDPIVEVSGEVTHEEISSPRKSTRRSHSNSPTRSPSKKSAARELFPDDEQPEDDGLVGTAVFESMAVKVMTPTVAEEEFKALQKEKELVETEKLALRDQLLQVGTVVMTQKEELATLKNELEALRQQLEAHKAEAEAARLASIASVQQELHQAATERESELEATFSTALSTAELTMKSLTAQLEASQALAEERLTELTGVREELESEKRQTRQAKESEEAARFSAQLAYAARDEAEERSRLLEEKVAELCRAVDN